MATIYPSLHLQALKFVPKYSLKAVVIFYGKYHMAYVNINND
jgi:hypothetical protein